MTTNLDALVERFFIDHGMIHDRVTGKHVCTEPVEIEEGQFDNSPTLETCALLNGLSDKNAKLVEAAREARLLIGLGGQKPELHAAVREGNMNRAWHLLNQALGGSHG